MIDAIQQPSFPRKRESSLSNNLRVADKAVFEVLSHFVGVSLIVWIPAFAGMTMWRGLHTVALVSSVIFNFVKLNKYV
jgi:hypothetical protein